MRGFLAIIRTAIIWLVGTTLGRAALFALNSADIYPERWLGRLIGVATHSPELGWGISGLFGLCCLIAWYAFGISERLLNLTNRSLADPNADRRVLKIIFHEDDPKCVRDQPDLYGGIRVRRWWVGLRNDSRTRSIDDISLRAQGSQFVACTITIAHTFPGERTVSNPVVLEIDTLPPGAEEFVELFGLSGSDMYSGDDVLAKRNTFVLEARGRDTQTVLATLEYDPSLRPPVIRRIS